MSRKITTKYDDDRPYPRRKEDGKWLCRWCSGHCPGRKTSYCTPECGTAAKFYIYTGIRDETIRERDHGVCADCGLDTERLKRIRDTLHRRRWRKYGSVTQRRLQRINQELTKRGFNVGQRLWQADHILPKILGGTDDPENFQTLCVPCHKAATKRLARYRATRRRKQLDAFAPHTWRP